jgi:hypothetical protein
MRSVSRLATASASLDEGQEKWSCESTSDCKVSAIGNNRNGTWPGWCTLEQGKNRVTTRTGISCIVLYTGTLDLNPSGYVMWLRKMEVGVGQQYQWQLRVTLST